MGGTHVRDGHVTQGTYSATYGYRYGGRLYNFTSNFPGEAAATFEYRGDGRLHRRTVGTDIKVYRYDAGWNAINTEDNAGALQAASVYEPGQEVGQRLAYSYGSLGTGTVVYAYHDQLGSTRRWRLNKSNWGANEYEPYGEAYAVSTLAPRDYALHEWDPAIAAYRAPYRNYSPAMARWMTRDPLGMVDGPNMYGYVGGRTINSYDPLGDIAIAIPLGGLLLGGGLTAYILSKLLQKKPWPQLIETVQGCPTLLDPVPSPPSGPLLICAVCYFIMPTRELQVACVVACGALLGSIGI